tara:strand:+ start:6152 stop:6700 length:549 start_codon:yes stop_codon:yes gene_type:complete
MQRLLEIIEEADGSEGKEEKTKQVEKTLALVLRIQGEAEEDISDNEELELEIEVKEEEEEEEKGGYGVAKNALYAPKADHNYADYDQMFRHVGTFKAKGMYEDVASPTQKENKMIRDGANFVFLDSEIIEKGIKDMKHRNAGFVTGGFGLAPYGVSSSEWEKFKLWTIIDPVMYNLMLKCVN